MTPVISTRDWDDLSACRKTRTYPQRDAFSAGSRRVPLLERAVRGAIEAEGLERSLLIPPDAIGPHPTSDGGLFHLHGVPLVKFLSAPFYLFDPIDRLDKLDGSVLVPLTRAAIRIVESTCEVSAAEMRSATPSRQQQRAVAK